MALRRKNPTIAEESGINVGTAKAYVGRLFEKLRVPGHIQAAYRAAGIVLLSGEEP